MVNADNDSYHELVSGDNMYVGGATSMKPKFKLNDEFRLRTEETFTRSFPLGGYSRRLGT
jgi:hypothetical protein